MKQLHKITHFPAWHNCILMQNITCAIKYKYYKKFTTKLVWSVTYRLTLILQVIWAKLMRRATA